MNDQNFALVAFLSSNGSDSSKLVSSYTSTYVYMLIPEPFDDKNATGAKFGSTFNRYTVSLNHELTPHESSSLLSLRMFFFSKIVYLHYGINLCDVCGETL